MPKPTPPTWKGTLSRFSAKEIIERIGCSRALAYQWKQGTKTPAKFVQRLVIAHLIR